MIGGKEILLANVDKIHTTVMGVDRIRKNLNLRVDDVVLWAKKNSTGCQIVRNGKN